MTAVPRFLQRLALTASTAPVPGAARAALPPRFGVATASRQGVEWPEPNAASMGDQPAAAAPLPTSMAAHVPSFFQSANPAAAEPSARAPARPAALQADAPAPPVARLAALQTQPASSTRSAPSGATDDAFDEPHSSFEAMAQSRPAPGQSLAAPTAPLRESTLAQHAAQSRAQQAPTIVQVTIDRIDVRAAPQPVVARPAAKARAPAAQSLGDYLRQRSGGPS